MKQVVTMPALSDTMNVGRLAKWLKHPGDRVSKGEAIAEVETDKAVMEVEAFHDGYLAGPLAPVDTDLPLGAPIGYIADDPAEAAGSATAPAASPPAAARAAPAEPTNVIAMAPPAPAATATRASPYARRLAAQLGVELHGAGTVHAADVLGALHAPPGPDLEAGPPYRLERNSSLREAVAQTMIAAAATPSFRVTSALKLAGLIDAAKARGFSVNLLLARAAARTVKLHPRFNAVYTPEGIAWRDRVDVAIAVDSPDGLITPVIRDAAERSFAELAADWRGLLERATSRRIAPADYRGATFYISDLGVFPGVYSFDSIVPEGAAALLSVAALQGETALATLNCDHRIVFGGDAARFLQTLAERLQDIDALIA